MVMLHQINNANFDSTCPYIDEWRVIHIHKSAFEKDKPVILKQIKNIRFPNLFSLHLSENEIESIEMLAQMWMPRLTELSICTPSITKLKTRSTASET